MRMPEADAWVRGQNSMVVLGLSDTRDRAAAAVAVDGQLVAAAAEAALAAGGARRGAGSASGLGAGARESVGERAGDSSPAHVASSAASTGAGSRAAASSAAAGARLESPDLAIRFALSRVATLSHAVTSVSDVAAYAYADESRWADADVRSPGRTLAGSNTRVLSIAAGHAAASLAAAALPSADRPARIIVIDSSHADAGAIFHRPLDGHLSCDRALRRAGQFADAIQFACQLLGLPDHDDLSLDALAELAGSAGSDDASPVQDLLRLDDGSVSYSREALLRFVTTLQEKAPAPLSAAAHPHLEVQRLRRLAASGIVATLTARVADIVASVDSDGTDALAFGGSLFASPRFNSHLADRLQRAVAFSPIPEAGGLAAGAALAASERPAAPVTHVALGPSFTEPEIKATLENCRIDFVYEPSWDRLLTRTSQLLARGKVIAWFQGRLDFGPRSLGSRSIFCDPSNRYARHNMNEYLLGRPLEAPLTVSMQEDDADEWLDEGLQSPFMLRRGRFRDAGAPRVRAALDSGRGCTVHTSSQAQSSELRDLLAVHKQQTGVPGLIHHPLRLTPGTLAATPRAALQAFFSSAIDAMVIGRFLLMKDYWLLRSDSGSGNANANASARGGSEKQA